MGRRLFDLVDGPYGWTDETGYGAGHATKPRGVVVTHSAPEKVRRRIGPSRRSPTARLIVRAVRGTRGISAGLLPLLRVPEVRCPRARFADPQSVHAEEDGERGMVAVVAFGGVTTETFGSRP